MTQPEDEPKIIVDEDWKSQVRAEKEAAEKAEAAKTEGGESTGGMPTAEEPASADEQPLPPLPPASFAELVTMFATQASVSLQQSAQPEEKQRSEHLGYAKHFIDLLAVVQEKTKGNLTDDEANMLENILHELRMAYVSLNR